MKKSIAAAAIALVGTGAGTASAFAADNTQPQGHLDNLIEAIAAHFNVSTNEVQAIFDEQRQEMIDNHIEKEDERLDTAVADGTLTQEQADALREHRNEMQDFMQSLEGMTSDERREAIEAQREENKTWAEENNIPTEFLPHEGQHRHGPHGMGPHFEDDATESEE